ncbi:twin-arginine translocase TatA/TatE family subunit [Methylocapsa aurea]|uniref:twin-arginine translocase TatA/TatE family subunit n=1 Tax=Methylocapsa aurea TaxID=663610 RepID=UPI000B2AF04E|nr:twin-arginine translocase TatA/TatE family subunit [Methylocapsa aurea]
MFDFDAGKLIIIGIVALVVIGPKELPRVLRQVGQAVGKLRRMAAEFQGQFMEAMREADIADIKADVAKLAESAKVDVAFNPVAELKTQMTDAIDAIDKPLSAIDAPALAAPRTDDSSLNSIALPPLSEAVEEDGASLLAAGVAPAVGEPGDGVARGVDAEMKALASALEAEMRTAEPPRAESEGPKAESSQRHASEPAKAQDPA